MDFHDHELARLLQDLPDFAVVLNAQGDLMWANSVAERQFERTLAEAVGRSALEFVHPDDLELVLRSLESVQSKSVGTAIEVRLRTGAGWRLVELIGAPVAWLEDGAVLFCLRDLTDRRRFEVARNEDDLFRSLVHHATVVTMLLSEEGMVVSASGALTRALGHDPERMENRPLADIVDADDRATLAEALARARTGASATHPGIVQLNLLHHGQAGSTPFELAIVNLLDDPTVGGLVVTAHDVSLRVAAERDLSGTLSLLRATLDATADGILVVDTHGNISSFNRRFSEMWQLPEAFLRTSTSPQALAAVREQLSDPDDFMNRTNAIYSRSSIDSIDSITFKDGRVFERYSKPQLVDGEVVGRVWSFRDSTERLRLEAELSYQAFHDGLTGLSNSALFRDRLDQAIARTERTGKELAVLFLDVDNFKTVNDSLGHSTGDQLLSLVADALKGCTRGSDTVARIGGDEFAILIEDVIERDEVLLVADRILEEQRRTVLLDGKELVATFSIGVSFGAASSTGDRLLRDADLAMYNAKEHGKNRYEVFRDHMYTTVMERLELEGDLRRALSGDELAVFYQPVVDLVSRDIVGFEALVRWHHPTRGLLQPADFIPFAERIGVVTAIDHFVLQEACSRLKGWKDSGLLSDAIGVSVNLSVRDMVDTPIERAVADALAAHRCDPASLILEITESAMMSDTDAAVRQLHDLKALGVKIAIDDFGTGYSSLAYLQQMPIDILKIDGSFVAALQSGDGSAGLAEAVIQIAETLGHVTVAEGIENEHQVDRLLLIGCALGQGFHLGPPLDAASTEALLLSRVGRAAPVSHDG